MILSNTAVKAGQTALLVLRINFFPGNDAVSLFINPTPGQPEPASASVSTITLDAGAVNDVVINNYGGFTTDEIRIGSTFESVTPVPEPALGFGLTARLFGLPAAGRS